MPSVTCPVCGAVVPVKEGIKHREKIFDALDFDCSASVECGEIEGRGTTQLNPQNKARTGLDKPPKGMV